MTKNLFTNCLKGRQSGEDGAQQPECTLVHEDCEHRPGFNKYANHGLLGNLWTGSKAYGQPPPTPSHALVTHSLTLKAGPRILIADLSQCFLPGEMWCLAGPNGAGKTTLMHTLAGLSSPEQGTIKLDGLLLSAWPLADLARRRALMQQARQAVFNMNVFNTVLLARYPYLTGWGWESEVDQATALAALEALQLTPLANRLVSSLSGGEQQRVALACALCQQAPLLLLDEPLASLDLAHQISCLHLLRHWLADQPQRTIIFSCHDLNLARHFATHALLLNGTHASGGPVYDILTPTLVSQAFHHPFKLVCDGDSEALMPDLTRTRFINV